VYLLVSVLQNVSWSLDDMAYGEMGNLDAKLSLLKSILGFRPFFKTGFNSIHIPTKYINNKKTRRDIIFEQVELISL
jgi:hypothetical protein